MLDTLTKWVGTLAPFIAPYPSWVKFAFVLFVFSGATWFVGLVVAAPTGSAKRPQGEETAWLTIKGVTAFGRGNGQGVRVTATVNGLEYIYPTLPGVEWLQIGPEMAPQSYQIPVRDSYTVRFAAELRNGSSLVSVEEQHLSSTTDGIKIYGLRELDRGQRGSTAGAEVRYAITRGSP